MDSYSSYILLLQMTSKNPAWSAMSVSIHIPAQAYTDLSLKSRQGSRAWPSGVALS